MNVQSSAILADVMREVIFVPEFERAALAKVLKKSVLDYSAELLTKKTLIGNSNVFAKRVESMIVG